MSQVAINQCKDSAAASQELQNAGGITDRIRERAFHLFQHRDRTNASDIDDWLEAERGGVWSPPSSLDKGILRIKAPKATQGAIATSR